MQEVPRQEAEAEGKRAKALRMIEQLIRELEGTGYKCFVPLEKKSCFDIAARGKQFLLLKVFSNIDSLRESQASDLHINVGLPPIIRNNTELNEMELPEVSNEEARES